MKKKVLFLGASGLIGPFVTPGLEADFDLHLADIKPHPDGTPVDTVDVTSYEQVYEASRGMDAIANFTVVRGDPVLSFQVNSLGAWHVMKAAVAHGIRKVIHSGPQSVRNAYAHDFDVAEAPGASGTGYYGCTKLLSREICRIFARTYGIQTPYFVFAGLGASPMEAVKGQDIPIFRVFWEDLQQACRLALEIESIPDDFQEFNLFSCEHHGKFRLDKAREILGFAPARDWGEYFKRLP